MPNETNPTYTGTIINFGRSNRGMRGFGYGFIKSDDPSVPDTFFSIEMLEQRNFPIPANAAMLNGLRVSYTVNPGVGRGPRIDTIALIGEPNYPVRQEWQAAAPQVSARASAVPAPQQQDATLGDNHDITGTIKWYDRTKRMGFILPDDGGPDVLIIGQSVGIGQVFLENQRVRFSRAKNIRDSVDRGWRTFGPITILDEQIGKLDPSIVEQLSVVDVFKKVDVEVVHFFRDKGYGFVVERGGDHNDESQHIYLHMDALVTYPFPNIGEGVEADELLRGITIWKNPANGKLAALPKIYETQLPARPEGAPDGNTALKRDRAPGEE